eukprot:TRINITY_DN37337_c0_g1_i1.p4 TRINITY_DN37337_c0_g1~~TRINITY_DN37337_c0_g1_i1.p4  ORF type:complete len:101 (+),score=2.43 TRINITY_DN37337_c0_g1_i1:1-303(+)
MLFIKKTALNLILALVFFRFFDIRKPYPINISQKLKGGFGIVIDDVIAGIYANFVLNITIILIKNIKVILLYIQKNKKTGEKKCLNKQQCYFQLSQSYIF